MTRAAPDGGDGQREAGEGTRRDCRTQIWQNCLASAIAIASWASATAEAIAWVVFCFS
jgi:hypothetical protein